MTNELSPVIRIRRSREEIQNWVRAYRESKLSLEQFARQNKLPQSSLYGWVRRHPAVPVSAEPWAEVEVSSEARTLLRGLSGSAHYQIVLGNGTVVRLPTGFDLEAVRPLMSMLAQL
jgi:hypothetical protein